MLDEWIGALAAAGIRRIDGRIIGNDQAFDDEGLGAGWAWDYLQYGYAAPVGALQYNEDVAALVVTPGATVGAPAAIRLENGSGLVVLNRGWTAAAGTETTIDYRRHLEQPLLEITGAIAARRIGRHSHCCGREPDAVLRPVAEGRVGGARHRRDGSRRRLR